MIATFLIGMRFPNSLCECLPFKLGISFSFPSGFGVPVWLSILALLIGYLGLHITVHPLKTKEVRKKHFYKASFIILSVGIFVLTWIQDQRSQIPIPEFPEITIETLSGLPKGVPNDPHLRLNRLIVRNKSDIEISNFRSRLQLPEPIFRTTETNSPAGTAIRWHPFQSSISVAGTGNKSIVGPNSAIYWISPQDWFFPADAQGQLYRACREDDLTGVWELKMDKLPGRNAASVLFLTSNGPHATNYLELAKTEFKTNGVQVSTVYQGTTNASVIIHDLSFTALLGTNTNFNFGTNGLRFSLEGEYQYPSQVRPGRQHFLVPIHFDSAQRTIHSARIQPDDGHWRRIIIDFD